jgi:hypothetical protein
MGQSFDGMPDDGKGFRHEVSSDGARSISDRRKLIIEIAAACEGVFREPD